MPSRNRSRRGNDRHRLPPLRFEDQPAEQQKARPDDEEKPEPEPAEQVDEAPPTETLSRRDRRRAKSPAAPENIGRGAGRADAKPAVIRQPFRHRSR